MIFFEFDFRGAEKRMIIPSFLLNKTLNEQVRLATLAPLWRLKLALKKQKGIITK